MIKLTGIINVNAVGVIPFNACFISFGWKIHVGFLIPLSGIIPIVKESYFAVSPRKLLPHNRIIHFVTLLMIVDPFASFQWVDGAGGE